MLALNLLAPFITLIQAIVVVIFAVVHNYGWTMIVLALVVRACFWPLNAMQFRSMLKMQQLQPRIAALKKKHKGDTEKLNAETMALYKETGANPLAGCLPILLQLPILYSLYAAIRDDSAAFAAQGWLWIGSGLSKAYPHVLARNLSEPDYALLLLYMISMYFASRMQMPAADAAMARQQKVMAFISPLMIGFFGYKYAWPSALIIYWLAYNVFTVTQQVYLIRKYQRPVLAAAAQASAGEPALKKAVGGNSSAPASGPSPARPGPRSGRKGKSRT